VIGRIKHKGLAELHRTGNTRKISGWSGEAAVDIDLEDYH